MVSQVKKKGAQDSVSVWVLIAHWSHYEVVIRCAVCFWLCPGGVSALRVVLLNVLVAAVIERPVRNDHSMSRA